MQLMLPDMPKRGDSYASYADNGAPYIPRTEEQT